MLAVIGRLADNGPPAGYGICFVVLFAWVGLTHGRWVCLLATPIAGALYVVPLLGSSGGSGDALASAAAVVPVGVLVGEIIATKMAELTVARQESEHRAELLHAVTKACRVISNLDRAEVLAAVSDALASIGFDGSAFTFVDDGGRTYRVEQPRGVPAGYQGGGHEIAGSLTAAVLAQRATVMVEDYAALSGSHPAVRDARFRATMAAPVVVCGELVGVLVAGSLGRVRFSEQDVEAFELLAELAGRALENARTFQDEVTARHQLAADNVRDDLTGIGNRRHAMRLLESLRPGDALALIDLDHFKTVNDTYGHAEGDAVLTDLGQFLADALRDGDDVARYGGEEFLLVLRGAGPGAGTILDRLTLEWRGRGRRTTFSTGFAVHERSGDSVDTLANADSALYAAKAAGRDRVRAFVP